MGKGKPFVVSTLMKCFNHRDMKTKIQVRSLTSFPIISIPQVCTRLRKSIFEGSSTGVSTLKECNSESSRVSWFEGDSEVTSAPAEVSGFASAFGVVGALPDLSSSVLTNVCAGAYVPSGLRAHNSKCKYGDEKDDT